MDWVLCYKILTSYIPIVELCSMSSLWESFTSKSILFLIRPRIQNSQRCIFLQVQCLKTRNALHYSEDIRIDSGGSASGFWVQWRHAMSNDEKKHHRITILKLVSLLCQLCKYYKYLYLRLALLFLAAHIVWCADVKTWIVLPLCLTEFLCLCRSDMGQ